ncbi:hypothetical protein BRADI_3g17528v3 [Brachypodium distachyon]|uniref:Uncharacterized protein n=1 Tax=Brachypodium distachyon TaxID=15368 RepID=A0A2K2CXU1_BRADI|nr:hypothetical protein BRADI_3g17528v3 [Brachypodium distachyon]
MLPQSLLWRGCLRHLEAELEVLGTATDWWQTSVRSTPSVARKGPPSIIMLTAWWIWKHRNAAVFDNATPNIGSLADQIKVDARLRARAGAVGLGALLPAST